MYKIVSMVAFVFMPIAATAQETIQFNGETCKVYPYKMEDIGSLDLEGLSNADIPYYPGKLEDGKYAVLYSLNPDMLLYNKVRQMELFANKPAAIFQVVNGKREGMVTFYSKKLDKKNNQYVSLTGSYLNGQRHGKWVCYARSRKGKIWDSTSVYFDNGLLNGPALGSQAGNSYYVKGQYRNGLKQGEWNYRRSRSVQYENGQMHGWYIDSSSEGILKMEYSHGIPSGRVIFRSTSKEISFDLLLKDTGVNYTKSTADSGMYYVHYATLSNEDYGGSTGPVYLNDCLDKLLGTRSEHDGWDYGYRPSSFSEWNLNTDWAEMLEHSAYQITYYNRDLSFSESFDMIGDHMRIKEGSRAFEIQRPRKAKGKSSWNYYYQRNVLDIGKITGEKRYDLGKKIQRDTITKTVKYRGTKDDYTLWEIEEKGWGTSRTTYMLRNFETDAVSSEQGSMETGAWGRRIFDLYFETIDQPVPRSYVTDSVVNYSISGQPISVSKTIRMRTGEGSIDFDIKENKDPHLPEARVLALTGHPKFYRLEDSIWVYQSYSKIKSKKDSVEWVMPDTVDLRTTTRSGFADDYVILDAIEDFDARQALCWLNGSPYTGKMRLFNQGKWKYELKVDVDIKKLYYGGLDTTYVVNYYCYHLDWNGELRLRYFDGLVDGRMVYEHDDKEIEAEYAEGLAHGTYVSENDNNIEDRFVYYRGKRTGTQVSISNSSPSWPPIESKYTITSSGIDGIAVKRDGAEELNCNFHHDTLQGNASVIYDHAVRDSFSFDKNLPHGGYRNYYRWNGEMRWALPKLDATLDHGALTGWVTSYFHTGGVSSTVKLDHPVLLWAVSVRPNGWVRIYNMATKPRYESPYKKRLTITDSFQNWTGLPPLHHDMKRDNYFKIYPGSSFIYSLDDPIVSYDNSWDGLYTYYFKGGIKSMDGKVLNKKRTGWWSFYTEAGIKFKEIYYGIPDSSKLKLVKDPEKIKGFCRGFDTLGRVAYEGFIMDESFTSTCATDANIGIEDLFYTSVYDSAGNNLLLRNQPVPVSERQITGARRFDGWWHNGQRDSTWYFYSSHGLLESAGKYKNGEKTGRWISGDLGGINALDNSCFDASDAWRVMQLLKELDFTEFIYRDGQEISRLHTSVQTDGFTRYEYNFEYFTQRKGLFGKVKEVQ